MARDFRSSGFGSAASRFRDQEDADPRVGLVNLADVMLVFACGLMLALVVNWNVDLPDVKQLDESQMQEVDDVEELAEEINSSSSQYLELGKAYQDPVSGKLYVLAEEDSDAAASGTSGSDADDGPQAQDASSDGSAGAASEGSSADAASGGASADEGGSQ